MGKPSLTGLRCAARRLGVAPHHLAVVGDDPELEMAMARRAGALGIAVTTGIHAANHFATLPTEQRPHLTVEGVGGLTTLLPALNSHPIENGPVPTRHGDVDPEARASSAAVTSAPAGSTCR